MKYGRGIEQTVGFNVESAAVAHRRFGGNDVALGNMLKNIRTHDVALQ
jgi:hypothetical protein